VLWRWSRGIVWSTVSNAVRSRRMSNDDYPESAAIRRSFVTLSRAILVLWAEQKLDIQYVTQRRSFES